MPCSACDTADCVRTKVILAPSSAGGPERMQQLFQDAMGFVRNKGKPSFFITSTCNPAWPEITRELLSGQDVKDK